MVQIEMVSPSPLKNPLALCCGNKIERRYPLTSLKLVTVMSEERKVKKSTTYQYISLRRNFSSYAGLMDILMRCKYVVDSQKIK